MEWIKDYWYFIIPGLIAAIFLFGFKTNEERTDDVTDHPDETRSNGKKHKGGHSCCP